MYVCMYVCVYVCVHVCVCMYVYMTFMVVCLDLSMVIWTKMLLIG